ncbi:MAG: hypothetical protein AzoDbin1_00973 [Azoarcus sp.]|uniref:Type II secretion system protein GspC N-terminal domain-containing protein n=1 Tax=Aromatoleum tolulyticum TaxID=34027 RepID=A0A1N6WQD7_9RHOO|nr:hypothetical protein [Aromatoleum tolulyticum]MCK9984501.1 hypothetical protein [Azoarcus sp.]SIQ92261.1 hypothetical protein SAMN05421829_10835 [Aromatoleum tolulyticum]
MTGRHVLLAAVLLATLAASWWAVNEDAGELAVVQPVERAARPQSASGQGASAEVPASSGGGLAILDAERAPWPELADPLARIVSFAPPPPPSVSMAPAAPQAPPLPFRYVGAIDDAQGRAVFLLEGTQVRLARPGEEIAGRYRVERITPSAVEFTYLPLKKLQTLNRQNP